MHAAEVMTELNSLSDHNFVRILFRYRLIALFTLCACWPPTIACMSRCSPIFACFRFFFSLTYNTPEYRGYVRTSSSHFRPHPRYVTLRRCDEATSARVRPGVTCPMTTKLTITRKRKTLPETIEEACWGSPQFSLCSCRDHPPWHPLLLPIPPLPLPPLCHGLGPVRGRRPAMIDDYET